MLVLGSLHPAAILRGKDGEAGFSKFENTVINDIRKALSFRTRAPDWDERVIWEKSRIGRDGQPIPDGQPGRYKNIFPRADEVFAFFQHCIDTNALVAVDVETTGAEPLDCRLLCITFASSHGPALCLPTLSQGGVPYWSNDEWLRVHPALQWFLAARSVRKTFHNGSFDTTVLWAHGLPVDGWQSDSMAAHHVADGELPHNLAFVASTLLDVIYWKAEVKGDISWIDLDDLKLRSYSIRDVLTTVRITPLLEAELQRYGIMQLYHDEIALNKIMVRATVRGLEVDLDRRDSTEIDNEPLNKKGKPNLDFGRPKGLGPRLRIKRAEALATLCQIAGHPEFNPRSPIHLRYLLFTQLKFPIVSMTEKGSPSTDKNAMVLLALHADTDEQKQALRALIEYRSADKMLGTWVEGLKVLGDGRVHPQWKLLPVTGRFSSSPNAQNWNKFIKRIFKAAKGYKFVSVDLSQAELRVMAYLSGDEELLRMYREGINVHTVNATMLFGVRCPPAAKDHTNPQTEAYLAEKYQAMTGSKIAYADLPFAPDDKWGKGFRTLAKNFVFGDNYGAEPETLYDVIRSRRDADTNELLFPDVDLGEIEGLKLTWERLHPKIPGWWRSIMESTMKAKFYQCPVSGRIRWFRGGFKRNEMLNFPVQTMVASWMNKNTILIDEELQARCGGRAVINMQVHDMLCVECPEADVLVVKEILGKHLNKSFQLPGFEQAVLPADEATVGDYLDQI